MKMLAVGEDIDAVEDGTGVATITTPFGPRRTVVAALLPSDAWNGTVKLQTSADNSTWSDVSGATLVGNTSLPVLENVALDRYVRYTCTAYTAGECSIYLLGGV